MVYFPFIDRLLLLVEEKQITKNKLLTDLNLGKNSFVNWQLRGNLLGGTTLTKIAEYFNVSVDFLAEKNNFHACPGCTFEYDFTDHKHRKMHQKNHQKYLDAKKKFGFLFNHREREQRYEALSIVKDETIDMHERHEAAIIIFKSYFSRSVEHNDYSLNHISLEEYIPYFLYSQGHVFASDLYDFLVKKYGTKSGMKVTKWEIDGKQNANQRQTKIAKTQTLTPPLPRSNTKNSKKLNSAPDSLEDDELTLYLEELRTRPELRMMFSLARGATKQDVEKAVKIIEALFDNNENGEK